MTRKEALQNELARLTQELEEVYERLESVRPPNVKPVIATKELLQEYELLLTRKTQIEKRIREINIEMTQLRRRK
jgi:predicted nuclease with TOPRIM domain